MGWRGGCATVCASPGLHRAAATVSAPPSRRTCSPTACPVGSAVLMSLAVTEDTCRLPTAPLDIMRLAVLTARGSDRALERQLHAKGPPRIAPLAGVSKDTIKPTRGADDSSNERARVNAGLKLFGMDEEARREIHARNIPRNCNLRVQLRHRRMSRRMTPRRGKNVPEDTRSVQQAAHGEAPPRPGMWPRLTRS